MTDNAPGQPDKIYTSEGGHCYGANDVFSVNYDGALLAKDAWELTEYTRSDIHATLQRRHDELLKVVEGMVKKVEWLCICSQTTGGVAGMDAELVKATTAVAADIAALAAWKRGG